MATRQDDGGSRLWRGMRHLLFGEDSEPTLREEIEEAIDEAEESRPVAGDLSPTERQMLRNLLHFGEQTAGDICVTRGDIIADVRKEPRIEDLPGWELEGVHGTDHLEGIAIVRPGTGERRHLPVSGLVVKISYEAATGVFAGQFDLDGHGAVVVDGELRTSRRGVFAAGDVRHRSIKRVASAVGEGATAIQLVHEYLRAEHAGGV